MRNFPNKIESQTNLKRWVGRVTDEQKAAFLILNKNIKKGNTVRKSRKRFKYLDNDGQIKTGAARSGAILALSSSLLEGEVNYKANNLERLFNEIEQNPNIDDILKQNFKHGVVDEKLLIYFEDKFTNEQVKTALGVPLEPPKSPIQSPGKRKFEELTDSFSESEQSERLEQSESGDDIKNVQSENENESVAVSEGAVESEEAIENESEEAASEEVIESEQSENEVSVATNEAVVGSENVATEPGRTDGSNDEPQQVYGTKLSGNQKVYEAIHKDAVLLWFGKNPKWNPMVFKDRPVNTKAFVAQSKSIVNKFGVDILIPSLRFDENASSKNIVLENHEVIQCYFAMKGMYGPLAKVPSTSGGLAIPLKEITEFANVMKAPSGATPSGATPSGASSSGPRKAKGSSGPPKKNNGTTVKDLKNRDYWPNGNPNPNKSKFLPPGLVKGLRNNDRKERSINMGLNPIYEKPQTHLKIRTTTNDQQEPVRIML